MQVKIKESQKSWNLNETLLEWENSSVKFNWQNRYIYILLCANDMSESGKNYILNSLYERVDNMIQWRKKNTFSHVSCPETMKQTTSLSLANKWEQQGRKWEQLNAKLKLNSGNNSRQCNNYCYYYIYMIVNWLRGVCYINFLTTIHVTHWINFKMLITNNVCKKKKMFAWEKFTEIVF